MKRLVLVALLVSMILMAGCESPGDRSSREIMKAFGSYEGSEQQIKDLQRAADTQNAIVWGIAVLLHLAITVMCGMLDTAKGYSGAKWWMGLVFGAVGLIYVAGLPESSQARR